MKIALYLEPPAGGGGVARCGTELALALARLRPSYEFLLAAMRPSSPWEKAYLHLPNVRIVSPCSLCRIGVLRRFYNPLWLNLHVPVRLAASAADIYFHTHYILPLHLLPPRAKKVLLLYDLMPVKSPEYFPRGDRAYVRVAMGRLVNRFDHVLAISESTRRDAIRHLGVDPGRISVIYPGKDESLAGPLDESVAAALKEKYRLQKKFILGVNIFHKRKNVEGLMEGFARSSLAGEYGLVLTGGPSNVRDLMAPKTRSLGIEEDVVFVGYVTNEELCALYKMARLFCFLSFDEGFGLPNLEAMAAGCPVVASAIPPHMEVLGDAAVFVDPKDTDGIARGIKRVARDEELRRSLTARGRERAGGFTWEASAKKVLSVFEKLAGRL